MVSVNPDAIRFFRKPEGSQEEVDDVLGYDDELAVKVERLRIVERYQQEERERNKTQPTPAEKDVLDDILNKALKGEMPETSSEVTAEADAKTESAPAEAKKDASGKPEKAALPPATPAMIEKAHDEMPTTPFYLPLYASPWLFIPSYIEPSFKTCSAIYVRHPTARPGYSEIPTPYDADGEVVRFAWEWYVKRRTKVRSAAKRARGPEDRAANMMEPDIEAGRKRFMRDLKKLKALGLH